MVIMIQYLFDNAIIELTVVSFKQNMFFVKIIMLSKKDISGLFLRFVALTLMICYLSGCGADDSNIVGKIPIISIELVESDFEQEEDGIRFRLTVDLVSDTDIPVLLESYISDAPPESNELGYTWVIFPKFRDTIEYRLNLSRNASWEISILSLIDVNLNEYPTEGFDFPSDFKFKKYTVGTQSKVISEQTAIAMLVDVWPTSFDSIPSNGSIWLTFDLPPKNLSISHGRVIIDHDIIQVIGPFPRGELQLQVRWDDGRGKETVWCRITDPDYEPPKLIRSVAISKNGVGIFFNQNVLPSPDTEKIELIFSEDIWVNEYVYGNIDIQTLNGDNLDWDVDIPLLRFNEIVLSRSEGKPFNPNTNYVIIGIVTDLANETEVRYPFTTSPRW